jgi:hypothetical protein
LKERGRITIKIQALVRRSIARLEYHERVRVRRELERKRRRIKEIEEYLVELREKTKAIASGVEGIEGQGFRY